MGVSGTLLLEWLMSVPGSVLVIGIVVTASLVVLVLDWRWTLVALLTQYTLAGIILSNVQSSPIAGAYTLAGVIACSILYLTARQYRFTVPARRRTSSDLFLRLLAIALAAVGLYGLPIQLLSNVAPVEVLQAALWLIVMGLLVIGLARTPMRTGVGLLTFQTGFELFYANLDSSLLVTGLLGIITILLALAISYLALAYGGAHQ